MWESITFLSTFHKFKLSPLSLTAFHSPDLNYFIITLFLLFYYLPFSPPCICLNGPFPSISFFSLFSYFSPTSPLLPSVLSHSPNVESPLLSCNQQFTGFIVHVVASQRKLEQHSSINNWRGPTWPGTHSLNGLFWEGSMPAREAFIRAYRWNEQGHSRCTSLFVT